MERMPGHYPFASSLRRWLRLETSLSGLWADREGLALGAAVFCEPRGHVVHVNLAVRHDREKCERFSLAQARSVCAEVMPKQVA